MSRHRPSRASPRSTSPRALSLVIVETGDDGHVEQLGIYNPRTNAKLATVRTRQLAEQFCVAYAHAADGPPRCPTDTPGWRAFLARGLTEGSAPAEERYAAYLDGYLAGAADELADA